MKLLRGKELGLLLWAFDTIWPPFTRGTWNYEVLLPETVFLSGTPRTARARFDVHRQSYQLSVEAHSFVCDLLGSYRFEALGLVPRVHLDRLLNP